MTWRIVLFVFLLSCTLASVSGCFKAQQYHFYGFSTKYKATSFSEDYSERSEDPRFVSHRWLSKEEQKNRLLFIGALVVTIEEGEVPSKGSVQDFGAEKGCDVVAMNMKPEDSYLYRGGTIYKYGTPHASGLLNWAVDEYRINCYRYVSDEEMERVEQRY